jgi:TonB family protein
MRTALRAIALLAVSLTFAPKQLMAFRSSRQAQKTGSLKINVAASCWGPQAPQPENIHDVAPEYPQIAQVAQLQGDVILNAIIDKKGRIKHLQAVSGPPSWPKAAMDAVKQWRYKPYKVGKRR